MFTTILVPTDGSELAEKAATAAVEFARRNGGRIIGLCVAEPYPYSPLAEPVFLPNAEVYEREAQQWAQTTVQRIAAMASQAGVPCETSTALSPDPSEEIVRTAAERGCDVIFIASHGRRGLSRMLLGSVTQKVLVLSKIPVLVFR
ncbi:universal stress protein [Noviherbaspirillum pedocola]|uniref:Universal stress protein n=1 Tax=Noviherbaspirillum pedocola TaxID=2801341 RepID=A0A934SXJ4_9BURK|nr:universal stress protein [Noviherbaspirillum pedocola]MBK4737587.1 universal stress protein [Noviherbaspirillum pedocola]